jgi:hypothetical protein
MVYRPKVFISHSAKEPETKSLCRAIAEHLDTAGFEVLWDQDLQTSDAWRGVIDEWIWRCDAAVLVLSQAATESGYVAYEAALLRQRWKSSARKFFLIPVWCPGVTAEVLTDRMGALQLGEIQTNIKIAAWPPGAADSPGVFDDRGRQAVEQLSAHRARLQARHEVEDLLITHLNSGTANEGDLRTIADKYNLPPTPAGAKKDLAEALARHILDFGVPLGPKRFEELAGGIGTMMAAMSDATRVPKIINLVAPFCWVSPAAAVRVAALCTLPSGLPRAIAWQRSWLLSERMYVYRGYCTRSKLKLKIATASDGAGGTAELILDHIRSVLAREVCQDQAAGVIEVAAKIKDLAARSIPVFLVLPARALDSAILSEVFGRWPEVCVFLFGEELDQAQVREQFPAVEFLDPPLTGGDESAAKMGWGECMDEAGIPYDERASGAAFLT